MKKIFWVSGIIVIIIVLLIIISNSYSKSNNETIKIGGMFVLSGDAASWGNASQNAVNLAVSEVNNNGGINGKTVEIIYEDTKANAQDALSIYIKFRDIDKVTAIIGPNLQSELGVIAPILEKDKIPIIAPSYLSTENRVVDGNPLLIWQDPSFESGKLAEYVYNSGIKTISILGTEDAWEKEVSIAFKNKFEELGGNVLYFELVNPNEIDLSTPILKATSKNPEGIFIGSYFVFLNSTKKLSENNYKGKLYSIEVDDYLASESKMYTNNLLFISPDLYSGDFTEKYFDTYGTKATIPAGQAYDSAKILFSILEKTTNKSEIITEFSKLKEYNGVSGKIIFKDNKTLMPLAIYKIVDGNIDKIEQVK